MITAAVLVAAVAAVRGLWSPCGLSMLSSLNPVSERARGNRYWGTVVWYLLGALSGGALLGAGCAAGAFAVDRAGLGARGAWVFALVAAVIAVASDSSAVPLALPDHPRQVDERWLTRYRRWIYATGYGAQIGAGFATYIMTAGVYLTAVLAALTGDPRAAFGIGAAFGLVRGLGILLPAAARTPAALRALLARLDALDRPALRVAAIASAAAGGRAAWALGGPWVGLPVAAVLAAVALGPAPASWPIPRRRTGPASGDGRVQEAAAA